MMSAESRTKDLRDEYYKDPSDYDCPDDCAHCPHTYCNSRQIELCCGSCGEYHTRKCDGNKTGDPCGKYWAVDSITTQSIRGGADE